MTKQIERYETMLTVLNKRVKPEMTDDEALVLLMKRHIAASLELSVDINELDKDNLLSAVVLAVSQTPAALVEEMGNAIADRKHLINAIRGITVTGYVTELLTSGKDLSLIDKLITNTCKIRDIVYPHEVKYIYVKLETGGFDGYQGKLKAYGEVVYPILRLTLRVNDGEALDILIRPDANAEIHPSTLLYLKELGIYQKALDSDITLGKAQTIVTEFLNKHDVRKDDIGLNKRNCLVLCNAKFVKAFLNAKFPTLMSRVGGRTVDVNEISALYELSGKHDFNPRPRYYSLIPECYLQVLADTVAHMNNC